MAGKLCRASRQSLLKKLDSKLIETFSATKIAKKVSFQLKRSRMDGLEVIFFMIFAVFIVALANYLKTKAIYGGLSEFRQFQAGENLVLADKIACLKHEVNRLAETASRFLITVMDKKEKEEPSKYFVDIWDRLDQLEKEQSLMKNVLAKRVSPIEEADDR